MSRNRSDEKQIFGPLAKELHELVSDKELLCRSLQQYFNDLIDELTIGIIFDVHRKYKTKALEVETEVKLMPPPPIKQEVNQSDSKIARDCICANCKRAVNAHRFVKHLQLCMGVKSRNTSSVILKANMAKAKGDADSNSSTKKESKKQRLKGK